MKPAISQHNAPPVVAIFDDGIGSWTDQVGNPDACLATISAGGLLSVRTQWQKRGDGACRTGR